jgi:glycosyltransferase involved in cell wall biosynthesis
MKVAIVAEFYPREEDPVLGVWAHRQALAARDAGADVRVFVLHRLVPPKADFTPRSFARKLRQPRAMTLGGIEVEYVPFVSPPRARSYGSWGRWAARPLAQALRRHSFDLVHAHNAVPAGDAALRSGLAGGAARGRGGGRAAPLVVSVHGGDVFFTAKRWSAPVARTFAAARMVLANSAGIAAMIRAPDVRVVHLGTDVPRSSEVGERTVVTVGHLVARKRHADVIRALPAGVPYEIVGDGPERPELERLAAGREEIRFHGQLEPGRALEVARRCGVFAMPSIDEAFGVAYIEAMAGGMPAIGCAGEPGPEEIARAGEGMRLVPAGDIDALHAAIVECLDARGELGAAARETVLREFTWERCGAATVAAYEDALR